MTFLDALRIGWFVGTLTVALAPPVKYTAHVEKFVDADTLWLSRKDVSDKCRLWKVDAPEVAHAKGKPNGPQSQPAGVEALEWAEEWCLGDDVTVTVHGTSYGRAIVEVTKDGKSLGTELVRHGWAWVDERYTKDAELLRLQREAKRARLGLWREEKPISPWDWRKGKR